VGEECGGEEGDSRLEIYEIDVNITLILLFQDMFIAAEVSGWLLGIIR
jgi:hypothetical protein